jgi:hypothetical protein
LIVILALHSPPCCRKETQAPYQVVRVELS